MKLVNILIGGVNRPVPVDDVVLVAATGKGGGSGAGSTVAITYASGKVATLTTASATDENFAVAQEASYESGFWQMIADAASQPWNQIWYKGEDYVWTAQVYPDSQSSEYTKTPVNNSVLQGKTAASLKDQQTVGVNIVWASIAYS
jgi:hypothetical protein